MTPQTKRLHATLLRRRCGAAIAVLVPWLVGRGAGAQPQNLAANPSAEEVQAGRPVGWGIYRGKGEVALGSAAEAHSGQRSACLKAVAMGEWRAAAFLNCGLMLGSTDGYGGRDAYPTQPGAAYRFSFWLKGTVPWVSAFAVCWVSEEARAEDRQSIRIVPGKLVPADTWRQYTGIFITKPKTRRFALKWHVTGFEHEGMRPGELFVDDVELTLVGQTTAKPEPRLTIPAKVNVTIWGQPIAEIAHKYREGDEHTKEAVDRCIKAAERWATKDDSWYLERTGKHTPLGMWTVACPFHPERVRDFSKDNFHWSIDEPWKLMCKLCKAEGRTLHYYPNERYSDHGRGCYPTDEVWRADHDAAWSRAHGNIPHDRWDGKPHGYSASGYCYYFIGKCTHEIMTYMANRTLPQLAEGYALAKALMPDGYEFAARCARRVKIAMLSLARAHLGDAYLADLFDLSMPQFDGLMDSFYQDDPERLHRARFPGYTPYGLQDGIAGHPKHPARGRPDIYGDGSYRGDAYARGWLRAYALIRDSFTEDEEPVRGMIERLLVSGEHDAKVLADTAGDSARKVVPGKLELAMRPFAMNVGSSNNLGGRELSNQFELGVLLNDPEIVDAVVWNMWFYLRNYFNSDGLGRETSPAYTGCAWNSMWQIFPKLYGYRGHYDPGHPWWDAAIGGLNPYRDAAMKHDVAKLVLGLFPDHTTVPWMDSHAGHGIGTRYINLIANEGRGLPEEYGPFYTLGRSGSRVVARPCADGLPSILLHESKKAVMRSGKARGRVLLSVDYAPNTGHWHPAPMDLVLYAKGHELASDLGYFGAMHWLTKDWIRTCPAHNTCIIRDENGGHDLVHHAQGEMRTLFKPGEALSVVEVCEQDSEDLRHIPGPNPFYQRTCALVRTAQRVGSEDHYVVDIFRVRGGTWHDYYFHSQGRRCDASGVDLRTLPPELNLYDASGFTPKQERPMGSGMIRHLRKAAVDGPFQTTWTAVPDFRGSEPSVDAEVGLRLTMLGCAGTELFLGRAPGQRRMSNVDLGEQLHLLCVRRRNRADVDRFVSLIEPFRGKPFIRSVDSLPVSAGACDAVALRVETAHRTDYLVSIARTGPGRDPVRVQVGSGQAIETDGLFTFLSTVKGEPVFLGLYAGTRAAAAGMCVTQAPGPEGRLMDFDDAADTLTVECGQPLPLGQALEGEVIIIEHALDTTTFTIQRVESVRGNRFRIHLKWSPHVLENYLRVTSAIGPLLGIAPPPSLRAKFWERHYQVYKVAAPAETSYVGKVRAATARALTLDAARTGLRPGDTIGVTKLRKGKDRFRVVTSVTLGQIQ